MFASGGWILTLRPRDPAAGQRIEKNFWFDVGCRAVALVPRPRRQHQPQVVLTCLCMVAQRGVQYGTRLDFIAMQAEGINTERMERRLMLQWL
jgi:hypothetical protein